MSITLKGAYDMHFHTAPDAVERRCTDLQLAERWQDAEMAGGVIKSHFSDTSGRASILRELYPKLQVAGGLVLNRHTGGINPYAVEKTAQMSGRYVWFPTIDAYSFQAFRLGKKPENTEYIRVLDEAGRLLPEAEEVLEVISQYNLILGTGHISSKEGMEVLRAAKNRGIKRMVVTHADNPANCYTIEQQKECIRLGAKIEHCYFTTYYGRCSWEQIAGEIKAVGAEYVILSTDFGQTLSPHSDEGMKEYAAGLIKSRILETEIEKMMVTNPRQMLLEN